MSKHVLILGGHGKISQLLTPILLKKSWTVTSIIRTEEQVPTIKKLGESLQGKLNVLVRSIEEVKSEPQAKSILDEVKPDYVVWSAGAGGRGGAERTYAIDRDAAIHFIRASAASPSITRFLMVSYLASRRNKPSWWDDAAWANALEVNNKILPDYYKAKIAADEVLYQESAKRGSDFVGINLRPGTLTTEPAGGVELGKTKTSRGPSSRESVAQVAASLLEVPSIKNCWVDMLDGEEEVEAAVKKIATEGVDCCEGEDIYKA
ncbi:NAD(P)-binding protein [Cryphonectria parasitica EP155]|uniref:NAD(P)-binding protein n=1 Tax=Cryphonectria parasitica (strain ATCC 38755 / EP155) TaxID=660469 RepID=A0A9P5CNY2_CRYP1|nr:NAD(P)-binding protein [Cryphonectria parasitica EP155]KAF3764420.1 NAD(P)-binding protein [Cryphonectria parasitica EP155]